MMVRVRWYWTFSSDNHPQAHLQQQKHGDISPDAAPSQQAQQPAPIMPLAIIRAWLAICVVAPLLRRSGASFVYTNKFVEGW
jgi:hypothetical protein